MFRDFIPCSGSRSAKDRAFFFSGQKSQRVF